MTRAARCLRAERLRSQPMMRHVAVLLIALCCLSFAWQSDRAPTPIIAAATSQAQKLEGYFNLYWHAHAGKLWLEIDKLDTEFLFLNSLPAGAGSNHIGQAIP